MLMRAYPDCALRLRRHCIHLTPQLAHSAGMHHRTMIALQTEPIWHELEIQKFLASIEIP
jgi:hypothetical protein